MCVRSAFLRCYPVSFQSSASLPGTLSQHAVKILQNSEISLLSTAALKNFLVLEIVGSALRFTGKKDISQHAL